MTPAEQAVIDAARAVIASASTKTRPPFIVIGSVAYGDLFDALQVLDERREALRRITEIGEESGV